MYAKAKKTYEGLDKESLAQSRVFPMERGVETEVRVGHEMVYHLQMRFEADPHSKEADPLDLGAGPLELEAVPLDPGAGPLDLEAVPLDPGAGPLDLENPYLCPKKRVYLSWLLVEMQRRTLVALQGHCAVWFFFLIEKHQPLSELA
ncbi:hypothetical protein Taro_052186 [Colocasia esculenta]|uniref:Uncharacterized protein n=1 Tax=Colocasia esculenta TaxID=4460 RepID=A0A843XIL8_COLES|nr:hypothetical protein [Colocasia esculenta]